MKVAASQIMTILIKVSAIIALTMIDEREWVAEDPDRGSQFAVTVKWNSVRFAGMVADIAHWKPTVAAVQ
jgi:hypothetical protein